MLRRALRFLTDVYSSIWINNVDGTLQLIFGENKARPLTHWSGNTFYVRFPVECFPHDDWFVEFIIEGKLVTSMCIKRLGWDEVVPNFERKSVR